MRPGFMATPILLRLLLITAIVLPSLLAGAILPAGAQSPLEEQRRQQAARRRDAALAGRVVAVQDGVIYTTITADWPSAGITDGTVLRVQLARRILNARFLSPSHYSQIVTDPAARKGLDVDVACTLNRDGSLAVVGLSGSLPEWLGVKSGSPVTVLKP
jgi:hypothetical protein